MGSPAIFSGAFTKFLKSNLDLFGKAYILTGTINPSVTATNAPKGSLFLRQTTSGNGEVYVKLDNGSSTNWKKLHNENPITDLEVALRDQLDKVNFNYLTSNIFETERSLYIDTVNSTGTLNEGVSPAIYQLTSSQVLRTLNLLDQSYLDIKEDILSAMLTVYYGTNFDNNATYQLSRDNGTTWQTISMTRNGLSKEYSGYINFSEETLSTEGPSLSASAYNAFNTTTSRSYAQQFTISTNPRIVKEFSFLIEKTGSPGGTLTAKIVKEASGVPSSNPQDLIALADVNIVALPSGPSTVTVNFGKQLLKTGTYFIVFETDSIYKSTYVAATTQIAIGRNSGSPNLQQFDGSSWSPVSGQTIPIQYKFKVFRLLLRITASAAADILGYGVYYGNNIISVDPFVGNSAVVGTVSEVQAGVATHSAIQSAISSVGFGGKILVLKGVYNENITLSSSQITIVGEGKKTVINGNLTISGNDNILEKIYLGGNLTISGNANIVTDSWVGDYSIVDTGDLNTIDVTWELI